MTNINPWKQLIAIMRLELIMCWRRGGLKVILLMALVLPPLMSWVMPIDRQVAQTLAQLWPADALRLRTAFAISNNTAAGWTALFLLPLILSEVIPLDDQYRTREFITALPLPGWVYLAGKLLAFWGVVLVGLVLTALITCGLVWAQYGPLDLPVMLLFWVTGYGLLALFSTQMGIMLAVGQPTRRQAILPGIVAVLLAFGAYFVLPTNDFLWQSLLLSIIATHFPGHYNSTLLSFPSMPDYAFRIGIVLLVMAAVWIITLWRIEHRQAHEWTI